MWTSFNSAKGIFFNPLKGNSSVPPKFTCGNCAARWDNFQQYVVVVYTNKPLGNQVHLQEVNLSFLPKKNQSGTQVKSKRGDREESSPETGKFRIKPKGQKARSVHRQWKHGIRKTAEAPGTGPSYQHGPWALCFHLTLGCIPAPQRGLDHQLLFDTSATCPAFISLHPRLRMQVTESATETAASPWPGEAHACQGPEDGKEAAFPGTSGQPRRLGLRSPPGWEGQPPGVLLLLGKWEVPTRPAGGKQAPKRTMHSALPLPWRPASLCLLHAAWATWTPIKTVQCGKANQSPWDSFVITPYRELKRSQVIWLFSDSYSFRRLSFML